MSAGASGRPSPGSRGKSPRRRRGGAGGATRRGGDNGGGRRGLEKGCLLWENLREYPQKIWPYMVQYLKNLGSKIWKAMIFGDVSVEKIILFHPFSLWNNIKIVKYKGKTCKHLVLGDHDGNPGTCRC